MYFDHVKNFKFFIVLREPILEARFYGEEHNLIRQSQIRYSNNFYYLIF